MGRLPALLLVALSLSILALAFPRPRAYMAAPPGEAALGRLSGGNALAEVSSERLIQSRRDALAALPTPSLEKELGLALLAEARHAASSEDEQAASPELEEARVRLRRGLAGAPADPVDWTLLAMTESQLGHSDEAVDALAMAYATGPAAIELAMMRSVVAMVEWVSLDDVLRAYAGHDFLIAMQREPKDFTRLARAEGFEPWIQRGFAPHGELLDQFNLLVASLDAACSTTATC